MQPNDQKNVPVVPVQLPVAPQRKKKSMLLWNLMVLLIVAVVSGFFAHDYFSHGQRLSVWADRLHELRIGSPLLVNEKRVGTIEAFEPGEGLARWRIVVELESNDTIADAVCRYDNVVGVRAAEVSDGAIGVEGESRFIPGPALEMRLGDPAVAAPGTRSDQRWTEFTMVDFLPDQRVKYNSLKVGVEWRHLYGLKRGAYVNDSGGKVGQVINIHRIAGGWLTEIAYFDYIIGQEQECAWLLESTQYFINRVQLTEKGQEGDIASAFFGRWIDVIPDPVYPDVPVVDYQSEQYFTGEQGYPPQILPVIGEQEIVLASHSYVEANAPLRVAGELAGYIHRSIEAPDSSEALYLVFARVRPWKAHYVRENTVFFLEPKINAQLFGEGWRPEVSITIPDPKSILRPGVAFWNPRIPGAQVNLEPGNSAAFTLHAEAEREWLGPQGRVRLQEGSATQANGSEIELPDPIALKFHWREWGKVLYSWRRFDSMGLALKQGVIGPRELFRVDVDEDKVVKPSFQIAGSDVVRDPASIVDLGNGLCFYGIDMSQSAQAISSENVDVVDAPVDVWIGVDPERPVVVSRARFHREGSRWVLSSAVSYQRSWHGAPVICLKADSPAYGKVIGVLLVEKDANSAAVVPFPANIHDLLQSE